MRAILPTVSLLATLLHGVNGDNFLASCNPASVKISGSGSGIIVQATCRSITGEVFCSRLNIGQCLKNIYGSIQDDPNREGPSITEQCINCSNDKPTSGILISGPSLLHCQCNPGTGVAMQNWPTAIFDINTMTDNNNGMLACHGRQSTRC